MKFLSCIIFFHSRVCNPCPTTPTSSSSWCVRRSPFHPSITVIRVTSGWLHSFGHRKPSPDRTMQNPMMMVVYFQLISPPPQKWWRDFRPSALTSLTEKWRTNHNLGKSGFYFVCVLDSYGTTVQCSVVPSGRDDDGTWPEASAWFSSIFVILTFKGDLQPLCRAIKTGPNDTKKSGTWP